MRQEKIRVWVAFTIVCVVWGSTWLVIKIGLTAVPPFLAAGVRFLVASLVLYALARIQRLRIPWTPDARKVYATLGILSFTIPFGLVYWAQQFIPSALSSIIFAAYPFWVALFAIMLLPSEGLDVWKLTGIVLGFAGVVIIFSGDITVHGPDVVPAMAAILVSTALQGFSLVVVKKFGQPINPGIITLSGMAIGAVLLLTLAAAFEPVASVTWNVTAVGSILYLAFIGSVLTFVSYYWLLKRIDPVYLSLTTFVNPIVAVILGALILGEKLEPAIFAGATLVLGGILVANGKSLYAKITSDA